MPDGAAVKLWTSGRRSERDDDANVEAVTELSGDGLVERIRVDAVGSLTDVHGKVVGALLA